MKEFVCWLYLGLFFEIILGVPKFDSTALMRNVFVPADAAVKSVIYRLKAYDTGFDYPLVFKLATVNNVVELETLNCTKFNSICQANVVLKSKLVPERFYDFTVIVENGKGDVETMECSFKATNATTPIEKIFPGAPSLVSISELSHRNSDVVTLRAQGNTWGKKKVLLELFAPPEFGLRQRIVNGRDVEGTIVLVSRLDYEKSPSHHLLVYANDPWTDRSTDTRNIATWPLFVSVLDEQDSPPIFTLAPPTTDLDPNLKIGDTILTVKAEDGDKGNPRDLRYFLVDHQNSSINGFFEIEELTGELKLIHPIEDLLSTISPSKPLLLTIRAKELRRNQNDAPSQSTDVQLALLPPNPLKDTPPKFNQPEYTATIEENSPPGTILSLKSSPFITIPKGSAFILEILKENGTFEISPNVITESSSFEIKVKNNSLLDYELKTSIEFEVSLRKFDSKESSSLARVKIRIIDVDDDQPRFRMDEWKADLAEDAIFGTSILKIEAFNKDGVEYSGLSGKNSDAFSLDKTTGVITLIKPDMIHSEIDDSINLTVKVTSKASNKSSTAKIKFKIIDVNDHSPRFERNPYEFIVDDDRKKFTVKAIIKAVDFDSTSPNNLVKYELIESIDGLFLNQDNGELEIVEKWNFNTLVTLHGRAYDGGIPRRSDTVEIRIYPPENKFRKMMFVVSGRNPNRNELEKTLSTIVGQKVNIEDIRPYKDNQDRSVIFVTVPNESSIIDIKEVQKILDKRTINEDEKIVKSSLNLWWIFWVILILLLIILVIALLCCICEGCPLYVNTKKRKTQLITENSGQTENKSVQVAEWFGRREAWSPELVDTESIRRHEADRGSDHVERHRKQQKVIDNNLEIPRDQLYIREGNADILRLITRGNEQQRPITLIQEQPYIIDNGKDILLKRFIDQQQNVEINRSNLNIAAKLQSENEVLEQSLRTQNALLRQFLAEREREIRLETQSLPAGTQTDHDVETQTEPLFLRPPKRKTRSDNEFSDVSEDEERTKNRRKRKIPLRRKINTPIQEESENNLDNNEKNSINDARKLSFGHTRTSLLRKKQSVKSQNQDLQKQKSKNESKMEVKNESRNELKNELRNETKSDSRSNKISRSALRREVLKEISASLLQSEIGTESDLQTFSDDSLEEEEVEMKPIKYQSQIDLSNIKRKNEKLRSQSNLDLSKKDVYVNEKNRRDKLKERRGSNSRYMEWYKKGKAEKKDKDTGSERSSVTTKVTKKIPVSETMFKSNRNGVDKKGLSSNGPDHPLIQHSKNRFEMVYPKRMEDDVDSGIVLTRPAATQKKSIFTIAYDDMQTTRIQQENHSPPL
ncbi:cadherin-86C [Onthophagus taurus]|uniref:cadherin-86C n=1 Tax=Onthophagus taurus TaxID=166361 RepID=UPI0039BEC8B9